MADTRTFRDYTSALQDSLDHGDATEHTHRPALKTLLEAAYPCVVATNEPSRIECGAPDLAISRNGVTVGYVEAKDLGVNLDHIERDSRRANPATPNGKQLKRYTQSLPNLALTNYTEFRWYVDGERLSIARLADEDGGGRLSASRAGISETDEMLSAFVERSPEPVSSPQDLALRMARLTHMIRGIVETGFTFGEVSQDLRDLYEASKNALVPDLNASDFADMFAQTLAYGLFAARVNHPAGDFRRQDAAYHIPQTNPFVRQLFSVIVGPSLDNEPFVSFVDDLVSLLDGADMDAILSNFGSRAALQDPIMHFYETFLAAYDPAERERRGVYYTPEPVVSYIVRSVDHLLRQRFDCPDGLADHSMTGYETLELDEREEEEKTVAKQAHRVLILDPACGTGSFLYAVIDHVREQYRAGGNAGMWDGYVREHLLKRIFGFELLMAPYTMAHLKLGMQLAALDVPEEHRADWAYEFTPGERLGIYLTNALDRVEIQQSQPGPYRVIAEEANSATEIKRDLPIMVVLGNPPYSGHSANASRRDGKLTWIGELIENYKRVRDRMLGERNPKWLQDDYVKFIRFGQWRIQQTGAGILAFITNNGYLDNPTFRGMRQQLMDTFTDIYLLDLHGNAKKKERAPDGGPDQNVFDIQQGVSIALFVKQPGKTGPATVHHADLYGTREAKYATLSASDVSTTEWELLEPRSPRYMFKPWDNELEDEYEQWPKITEVMPVNSVGVVTARDKLTIQHTPDEVMSVVNDFATLPAETARTRYSLGRDVQDWKVQWAQDDLKGSGPNDDKIAPLLYRPFDTRYTYYTGESRGFICRPRSEVMRHMLAGSNLGLITCRQQSEAGVQWNRCGVTRTILDECTISNKTREINYLFPLYTYTPDQESPENENTQSRLNEPMKREHNFSSKFTERLEESLGLRFVEDGRGDLYKTFGPDDALLYIYAVFHSTAYRKRYDQFLRADFPRVPITGDVDLFRALAGLGRKLAGVHLMESPVPNGALVSYPVTGDNVVERAHPRYFAPGDTLTGEDAPIERGRVYISANGRGRRQDKRGQYFDGIAPEVWESRIGGYQPLHKWLSDRKGRELTFGDVEHYKRIVAALETTAHLMDDVDAAIADTNWFR